MSRRATREGQRLAEDVAAKVYAASEAARRRPLSRAEAKQIKADLAREQEERRATSMRVLLKRQYAPWLAGLGVFAVGAVTWLLSWLAISPMLPVAVAALTGLCLGWAAWMMGHRHQQWRRSLHRAAIMSAGWLLMAAITGPSWSVVLVWAVLVVLSSSSWWKANRIPYPTAPSPQPVPETKQASIEMLWDEHLGAPGAVLQGSVLSGRDDSKTNCESYVVNLRPGKQTITGTIAHLELISSGLHTPVENLVLEPHEDRSPTHAKLTVVRKSPIEKTMEYSGARLVGDQRHVIEVGPYGDGDGWARWRMWEPGEQPMTGSWLSGCVIAGTGIGKSRLMELLAAGYMASGSAVVWFVDPQGGASSPALQEYADWYVSSEGVGRMLGALEAIAKAREAQNALKKWSRFDPTPERPGIVVFLDECHVTIEKYAKRLEDLARKTQKVGIGFVGLTQGASLESLGKDILRACLTANLIVMKTGSNQTKNLLPGLTVNPEMLPKIAGFGYTIGDPKDGTRTAPFRSEYVAEPERWFQQYRMPRLDALSANAAGDVYQLRSEAAAEEQEKNRRWVEQLESGEGVQPTLDEADDDVQDEPAQGGAFQVAAFPSAPRPQDKPPAQRIIALVAQGVTRTKEIEEAIGLKSSQTAALLRKLVDEEHLEQPTRGVYAIAGSASVPER
ncbi:MAG TPA: hypothetical protein VGH54_09435 [Mycobacterium sp.]|jgi:hypothetical protein|uniref:hypothetical protein n=1 Tax=Mycobacterium sp. TaxID=1785 RepID=UPI002F3F2502